VHTRDELARDFRALGVRPGDVVMLHASIRAVGEVAGGPDQIHLALKDALGPAGTLFMYAGVPRYVDEVGRGDLTAAQEAEVLGKLPAFDPRTARSDRGNGALVELLRTWPDTRVNEHPARFAAWGREADRLLAPQPWDFAYGEGSVLDRFVELDGRILLLGSDHDNVTFLHHAEHVLDVPGKRVVRFRVPVLENGRRVWREMSEYDTSKGAHPAWPDDIFSRIVDGHLRATHNEGALVGDARSFLIRARDLLAEALEIMRRIARGARGAARSP
jgi:aminoglycoside 3-N-acetyltransferase